jgi:hypothetical protein
MFKMSPNIFDFILPKYTPEYSSKDPLLADNIKVEVGLEEVFLPLIKYLLLDENLTSNSGQNELNPELFRSIYNFIICPSSIG